MYDLGHRKTAGSDLIFAERRETYIAIGFRHTAVKQSYDVDDVRIMTDKIHQKWNRVFGATEIHIPVRSHTRIFQIPVLDSDACIPEYFRSGSWLSDSF